MKTIILTDSDYAILADLQHQLQTQDDALTDCPAYVIYRGTGYDDPAKRVDVICFTAHDADLFIANTKHHGPAFIYVHSFARGRSGRWLHNWLKDELPNLSVPSV